MVINVYCICVASAASALGQAALLEDQASVHLSYTTGGFQVLKLETLLTPAEITTPLRLEMGKL
eukprot:403367-Hanusia_phi.AAC.1